MTRNKFDPKAPIAHFLISRGVMPTSHLEIIERCYQEVDREELDHKTAIGLTATGLITGGVMLAALGVTPFLLPAMASVAVGGLGVWNHPLRAQRREDEADFLRSNAGLLPLMAARIEEGHPAETIKAAYSEAFRAWRSTGKPDLDVMALGSTTPLHELEDETATALQSSGLEAIHEPTQVAPGHQPIAPTSVTVPVSVNNYLGRGESAATPVPAIPAPGRVQTEPPDLSLYPDPADRAMALMTAMAKAGMPIASILKHPFITLIGGSQSGKTGLSSVLSVLRMATGCSCLYATVDDDVPPVRWSKLASSPLRYVETMDEVADTISAAGKGALIGQSWVFDEVLRSSQEFGADITKLLIPSLTKGAKTGGLLVVLTHAKTVSAHNLKPGFSEAWERDRVAIEALRERDQFGSYSPKGEYLVSIPGEAPEVWRWPEWMVTNLDPVGWVLDAFPEFKGSALEGADRGQDRPFANTPSPTRPAPAWASREVVPAGSRGGSGEVPDEFRGSEISKNGNLPKTQPEPLEPPDSNDYSDYEKAGTGSENLPEPARTTEKASKTVPVFTVRNLTREQTIATIKDLLGLGVGKVKIIEKLWECSKGGGPRYTMAAAQYDNIMDD